MSDNFDVNGLAEWIRDKAPEFSCALAARIALRTTPILHDVLGEDATARRTRIVLPSFRALAAANFAGTWPNRFGGVRRAARSASRSMCTTMEEAYNESKMNLIHGREAVPEEFLYIHSLEAQSEAMGVASRMVDTVAHALQVATRHADSTKRSTGPDNIRDSVLATANSAHSAVDGANGYSEFMSELLEDDKSIQETPEHVSEFWKAVERDVLHLEEKLKKHTILKQQSRSCRVWLFGVAASLLGQPTDGRTSRTTSPAVKAGTAGLTGMKLDSQVSVVT